MENEKEIIVLRSMIEESVGRKMLSPSDFQFLTGVIAERCKETLGVTTLKRIWGYIDGYDTLRNSTLSILARCVGYRDWADFQKNYHAEGESSNPVLGRVIESALLETGVSLRVTWAPDRRCTFLHLGDGRFEVTAAENSKLRVGDTFHCSYFVIGQPLYMDDFVRCQSAPSMFVVGNKGGLSEVSIL